MTDPTATSPTASPAAAGVLDRVRATMRERNLGQQDLAGAIGVSESVMSRIMAGQRKLSAAELGALADLLQVSSGYLLGRSASDTRPFAMAARLGAVSQKMSDDGADGASLEPAFGRARTLLELRGVLDRIVEAPPRKVAVNVTPVKSGSYVKSGEGTAARVRKALGLGGEPIVDVVSWAEEAFGVDVSAEPLDSDLLGVFMTEGGSSAGATGAEGSSRSPLSVMLVNSCDPYFRQRFTVAHEVGHLVFGDADLYWADYRGTDEGAFTEKRANSFAAALLAPADGVRDAWAARGRAPADGAASSVLRRLVSEREQWLAEAVCAVSLRFGLSVESTVYRCDNLSLLTPQDKEFLLRTRRYRLWDLAGCAQEGAELEDAHFNVVSPPPGLAGQALFAYSEGMIGIDPLAQLWRSENPEELRGALAGQGWAPTFG